MNESESGLKPYLSQAINYSTDIEPYRLILLWAGVGAGKNELIMKFITGDPEHGIPPLNVLLITSRKAKVIETLSEYGLHITNIIGDERTIEDVLFNTPFSLEQFERVIKDEDDFELTLCQRSVICTNAFIEKYHQYCFDPSVEATHLWNRFDVIVWDEAHSLIMDSSYQSAPYHVVQLLKETNRRIVLSEKNEKLPIEERDPSIKHPTCQRIILMTGTPEPLAGIKFPSSAHLLDMRPKCRSVYPHNIHFIDSIQTKQQIRHQLKAGERIVYFSNHVVLPDDAAAIYDLPVEKLAVSFSDESRRKELKPPDEDASDDQPENNYKRMVNVEKHLSEHSRLRSDIALFITTSKNKEGINIKDDDIQHVYIESHSMTDIIQMAGRIRSGAEHVYIVMDSRGHGITESCCEDWLDKKLCTLPFEADDGKPQQLLAK